MKKMALRLLCFLLISASCFSSSISYWESRVTDLFESSLSVANEKTYFGSGNEYEVAFELAACELSITDVHEDCIEIHKYRYRNKADHKSLFLAYLVKSVGIDNNVEVRCNIELPESNYITCVVNGRYSILKLQARLSTEDIMHEEYFFVSEIHGMNGLYFYESINSRLVNEYRLQSLLLDESVDLDPL
jgi:hypothetical protein